MRRDEMKREEKEEQEEQEEEEEEEEDGKGEKGGVERRREGGGKEGREGGDEKGKRRSGSCACLAAKSSWASRAQAWPRLTIRSSRSEVIIEHEPP
ncbi:hypothetical protein M0802_004588 [Mischocyttarus mexicanus]|nr:hypothetical protein M0802_004588 [Mischocyttarus mexicanus]